ncbi:protein of unknown function [Pseudodesulfovibrio profundus]|uniref:KAP NTPase domain-containing protein n=1 Tax=Pseudodesulfovibrio profundus TaxID=57320 RepID=A0A2C8FDN5_9BACT|nr:P-loop NTPase fold protein [Pseudodesulfovibrio profundus]SOB60651.1 protein of unknown function [Pseudodesulfovibrio profundus]
MWDLPCRGLKELAEACGADDYAEEISEAVTGIVTKQIEEYSERKSSTENFTSALEQFVEKNTKGKGPLIIFVDELDRCRPNYAVELLERIKHLFDVENIVFVLSVDLRQLKYAVESIYGSGLESEGYLRRFFDIVIDLPELSKKDYCSNLCEAYGLEENTITPLLSSFNEIYPISLRQIDRVFTLLKIQVGTTKWNNDYLINLYSYTILKVLDDDKYNLFSKNKMADDTFKSFVKELHKKHPYCAAAMMSYMVETMATTHRINRREEYDLITKDKFWEQAFNQYGQLGDTTLTALFNRLDFTADHARTGFDY